MKRLPRISVISLLCFGLTSVALAGTEPLTYEEQIISLGGKQRATARIPKGYQLEFLAVLDGPRLLTFAPNGDLFVGSKSGNVYRLPPPYTKPDVLVTLDDYPHSIAFRKNEILIARTHGLYRALYKPGQQKIAPGDVTLLAALPGGRGHNSRTVGVGPDGRVYLSLGITGNCSDEYLGEPYRIDDRRGGILLLKESGAQTTWEAFGTGLRNPVGFAWHPKTKELYASNNGPDHLGFDQPPEYFSRVSAGSFHGMPWFQYDGKKLIRDDCVKSKPPRPLVDIVLPVATFPARNAPMSVAFVPAGAMDKTFEFDAIVALRGSWGTKPSGSFLGDSASRRHPIIQKGIYRTADLISHADLHFLEEIRNGLPEKAKEDVIEAGKCLAYEIPTACAFHMWRAIETVMCRYYQVLTNKTVEQDNIQRNWDAYIKALEKNGADKKITEFLNHIRMEYRNPQTHPTVSVSLPEAYGLFGAAFSSINQMIIAIQALAKPKPGLIMSALAADASPSGLGN